MTTDDPAAHTLEVCIQAMLLPRTAAPPSAQDPASPSLFRNLALHPAAAAASLMRVAVFSSSTVGAHSAAPMVATAAEVAVFNHLLGNTGPGGVRAWPGGQDTILSICRPLDNCTVHWQSAQAPQSTGRVNSQPWDLGHTSNFSVPLFSHLHNGTIME